MTNAKLEALTDLKAKVEAGEATYLDFSSSCHVLNGFHGRAFEACSYGSVDAAIALEAIKKRRRKWKLNTYWWPSWPCTRSSMS